MTGPGTNTYLVGGEQMVIIDPGPAEATHQQAITAALHTLKATAQAIILTHHHADHSDGAEILAERLNIPTLSFAHPLQPGDEIPLNLHPPNSNHQPLTVFHTPGHTYAHVCLWLAGLRLLFAGDLVAGAGTVLIVPPDGDMTAYLDSLRAMQALNPAAILPGHGPVIEQPQPLLQQYLDHRLKREQQVLDLLAQGYTTAADIAAHIYADQPQALPIASQQVEAHLIKLRREGRA